MFFHFIARRVTKEVIRAICASKLHFTRYRNRQQSTMEQNIFKSPDEEKNCGNPREIDRRAQIES